MAGHEEGGQGKAEPQVIEITREMLRAGIECYPFDSKTSEEEERFVTRMFLAMFDASPLRSTFKFQAGKRGAWGG